MKMMTMAWLCSDGKCIQHEAHLYNYAKCNYEFEVQYNCCSVLNSNSNQQSKLVTTQLCNKRSVLLIDLVQLVETSKVGSLLTPHQKQKCYSEYFSIYVRAIY